MPAQTGIDQGQASCGAYLMPAAQTRDKNCITPGQMVKLIAGLKEQFDYIILDCPAGIETGISECNCRCRYAIVVTTPEVSAIRDADRIIGLLEANEIKKVDLVVNRLRSDLVRRGEMMTVEDVIDILGLPYWVLCRMMRM